VWFDLVRELTFPGHFNSRTPSGTLAPELKCPGTVDFGAKEQFRPFELFFWLQPASQATSQSASQPAKPASKASQQASNGQVRPQQQLIKPGSNHGGRQADLKGGLGGRQPPQLKKSLNLIFLVQVLAGYWGKINVNSYKLR